MSTTFPISTLTTTTLYQTNHVVAVTRLRWWDILLRCGDNSFDLNFTKLLTSDESQDRRHHTQTLIQTAFSVTPTNLNLIALKTRIQRCSGVPRDILLGLRQKLQCDYVFVFLSRQNNSLQFVTQYK
ncbi:hypothetical protein D3C87_1838580 [compost metagenome]